MLAAALTGRLLPAGERGTDALPPPGSAGQYTWWHETGSISERMQHVAHPSCIHAGAVCTGMAPHPPLRSAAAAQARASRPVYSCGRSDATPAAGIALVTFFSAASPHRRCSTRPRSRHAAHAALRAPCSTGRSDNITYLGQEVARWPWHGPRFSQLNSRPRMDPAWLAGRWRLVPPWIPMDTTSPAATGCGCVERCGEVPARGWLMPSACTTRQCGQRAVGPAPPPRSAQAALARLQVHC